MAKTGPAKNTREPNASSNSLRPGLYIVATPIGNLGDITRRAIETLRSVDIVACEDTRVTGKLLNAMLIKTRMVTYHEHNGAQQRPKILDAIAEGKAVALVSDAGTPLISDPGYKLVADTSDAGHYVTTLPGASALTSALTLSGLPTDRVLFMGFAPNKSSARFAWFQREQKTNATLVCYESAKRVIASLRDAQSALGDRHVAVCREITKRFEEVVRGTLPDAIAKLEAHNTLKGEIVVVIEGAGASGDEKTEVDSTDILVSALKHMSVKTAAAFVADLTGQRKKALYQKALELTADQ